ncbi:hypothetical protein Psi02_11990 [Planotetraspora silvatica]|uniref:Uncharacterized protein n=1 Tax=Planotetraspora silvatica TaxID=234614 RepID=A0A8J3UUG2_9ACTN|nr:hypothetical protein [Planotetraspora silvatica]GII44775.1 hypothetical protein Psi02_11990 [Planotetraspora silvatica]
MSVAEEKPGRASPPGADHDTIRIVGAREHNHKGVSLRIPKNKITVFIGTPRRLLASGNSLTAEPLRRHRRTP